MKIGLVCYPSLGGSGILATELGHQLALRGHEVHFIAYDLPFRLRLEACGVFFHEVPVNTYELFKYPDYGLTLAVKMAQVAREYQLDVFHVHYAIPHATSGYLACQLLGDERPRLVTTLHGTDITLVGRDPSFSPLVKFSMAQSDAVTCVSESLAADTRSFFTLEHELTVIPNFFVPRESVSLDRSKWVRADEKLVVHSSNFRPVKRVQDVVDVFARIKETVPSKLLLLGAGEGLGSVRRRVSELGLEEEVHFLGPVRDIDSFVASADLYLLTSELESFGLSALEAMAYGTPVVASRVGGLSELVEDGVSGYLAGVGEIDSFAEKALKLLSNDAKLKQFGYEARQRATKLFSADVIVPRYEAIYESLRDSAMTCT